MDEDFLDPDDECLTCLAVASGGRIRLTEAGAAMQMELLQAERRRLLGLRRSFIANESWEMLEDTNARLKTLVLMWKEVKRTRAEMGWHDGQPQLAHS